MKKDCLILVAASFLTVAGLSIFAPTVTAQHPVQPADTTNPERVLEQQQSQREMQLRNLGAQAEMSKDPRRVEAIKNSIEQDFQKILLLHNQLARFLLDHKPLDYEFVSDAGAEIKKRASHLQRTLALNPTDESSGKEKYTEFSEPQMRDGVATLCQQIKSFVTNPIIEKPGTVNEPQLKQARNDLQDVIDLSISIKKSADKLRNNRH